MFGLPMNQVIAIGVLIVGGIYMLYANWDSLPKFKLPWGGKAKATKPDRKAILSILEDAYSYFEAEKCTEGKAAIRTAMGHVFHEHTEVR